MPKEQKSKPRRRFWTKLKLAFLVIFLIGLFLGIYLTNQVIDPYIGAGFEGDYNALQSQNQLLDSQLDSCMNCLNQQGIDPSTCKPRT